MKASLNDLFQKYLLDRCSEAEVKLLLEYFNTEGKAEDLKALIVAELQQQDIPTMELSLIDKRLSKIRERVGQHIRQQQPIVKLQPVKRWRYVAVAASIAIVLSLGLYFYNGLYRGDEMQLVMKNDIAPGKKTATLTLANGQKIVLSDQTNGQLATEAGVVISKTADGELNYKVAVQRNTKPNQLNVLSTAVGEAYTISLPDGSKIWLNAESSITFPVSFSTLKHRTIKLIGEAYFEIAKDKQRPFVVETGNQKTEVLGTHFNIKSYRNERITTTLLEGSLRVTKLNVAGQYKGKILKPGEASVLVSDGGISIMPANIKEAMAWKNGFFRFDQLDINQVMAQLSRWYEIDVVYEGEIPKEKFNGVVARNKNISEVLLMLSYTKAVKFKIEGRKVTVMR